MERQRQGVSVDKVFEFCKRTLIQGAQLLSLSLKRKGEWAVHGNNTLSIPALCQFFCFIRRHSA